MYDDLDLIGAEPVDIAKMFGQMLSGAGGMFKPQAKGQDAAVAAAAIAKAQEEKQRAEASAARMKTGLLAAAAAGVVGGAWWLKSRK